MNEILEVTGGKKQNKNTLASPEAVTTELPVSNAVLLGDESPRRALAPLGPRPLPALLLPEFLSLNRYIKGEGPENDPIFCSVLATKTRSLSLNEGKTLWPLLHPPVLFHIPRVSCG